MLILLAVLPFLPSVQGVYLVADTAESADAWVDALVLAQHLVQTRSSEALADALMPSSRRGTSTRSGRMSTG